MSIGISKINIKKRIIFFAILIIGVIGYSCHLHYIKIEQQLEKELDKGSLKSVNYELLPNLYENGSLDKLLGKPYISYSIKTNFLNDKEFLSTLIEYPFEKTISDSLQKIMPRGIVLYVHGYNDYFFNREMAEKFDSLGYAFFAIDLHYCGRSYRKGESRADMQSIKEYYAELDYAVELSRYIIKEKFKQNRDIPYILLGHSLGGLITSLYANDRSDDNFSAVILNSPFFDMNFNWFVREVVMSLISEVALYFPRISIGSSGNPNYSNSIYKEKMGEWDYNIDLKSLNRPPQYLGWLRAVHKGQLQIHSGLDIKYPIGVLHSNCSIKSSEWSEEYTHCDGVLDVEHISKWSSNLGKNVKVDTIVGSLHDVFLSKKEVREKAYKSVFDFLESKIQFE